MDNTNTESYSDKEMSKGVSYFIIGGFVIILFFVIFFTKESYLKKYLPTEVTESSDQNSEYLAVQSYNPLKNAEDDTDGDGIENWKEITYGTDPDTKNSLPVGFDIGTSSEKISAETNLTDNVSKDLYVVSQYKKNDPNMDTTVLINSITNNVIDAIKPQRLENINLVSDNSYDTVKEYGKEMSLLFMFPLSNSTFIELLELKENKGFAKTLDFYKQMQAVCEYSKNLKNVPVSFAELHKDFIYNCETYTYILSALINNNKDPVKALAALKLHEKSISDIVKNLKDFSSKLLLDNKIKYENTKTESTSIYYLVQ